MKCINVVVVLVLFFSASVGKDWWWKTPKYLGITDKSLPYIVLECSDGNLVTANLSEEYPRNAQLTKFDTNCDTIWSITCPVGLESVSAESIKIIESNDSSIYAYGVNRFAENPSSIFLIKIDVNGNKTWSNTYGENINEFDPHLIESSEGFLYFTSSIQKSNLEPNICTKKLTADGIILWEKEYEVENYQRSPYILETTSGMLFLTWQSWVDNVSYISLSKLDSTGVIIWCKQFDDGDINNPTMIEGSNNTLFLQGWTKFVGSGINCWLLNVTADGEVLWNKVLGGDGFIFQRPLVETIDESFYFVDSDLILKKINNRGETQWSKSLGEKDSLQVKSMKETSDGALYLTCAVPSSVGSTYDNIIQKIDSEGTTLWVKECAKGLRSFYSFLKESTNGERYCWVLSRWSDVYDFSVKVYNLPPTQYCSKFSPLQFHVGDDSPDSLEFGYVLIDAPEEMYISKGGTVHWAPHTDSVYLEQVTFIRATETGLVDTLWFDVWANREKPLISVIEPDKNKEIVSQNPIFVTANTNILTINSNHNIQKVELFDLQGRLLKSQSLSSVKDNVSISTTNFATGLYVVKVNAGDHQFHKTVVLR